MYGKIHWKQYAGPELCRCPALHAVQLIILCKLDQSSSLLQLLAAAMHNTTALQLQAMCPTAPHQASAVKNDLAAVLLRNHLLGGHVAITSISRSAGL